MNAARRGDLEERLYAYRDYMAYTVNVEIPQEYVVLGANSYAGGYACTKSLLSLPTPPTAVFAMDDVMAIGALAATADRGMIVPDDLSVVGFDDMEVSSYVRPALTTVHQPVQELVSQAVDLLLRMIGGEDLSDPWPQVVLETTLVIRDSCGAKTGIGERR